MNTSSTKKKPVKKKDSRANKSSPVYVKKASQRSFHLMPVRMKVNPHCDYHSYTDLFKLFPSLHKDFKKVNRKKTKVYVNEFPCSFDTETTTLKDGDKQYHAFTYAWMFAICTTVFTGRTWDEFNIFIQQLSSLYQLGDCEEDQEFEKRLIIYVHNLPYEFQFMRKELPIRRLFATDERKAIRVEVGSLIFKDSLILSGMSLEKTGENLIHHYYRKASGDLNYSLVRTVKTPLTYREKYYNLMDVLTLNAYIEEEMNINGGIEYIPMTKTGYVRRYIRNACAKKKGYYQYIHSLVLTDSFYQVLRHAFAGGFTHASVRNAALVFYDVDSIDFTSSYPYVLLSEKFPASNFEKVIVKSKSDFYKNLDYYSCIFMVKFINLQATFFDDNYISKSKCFKLTNPVVQNGRVVSADEAIIYMTEVDYSIIEYTYKWDSLELGEFYRATKDYLPLPIINSVLNFYEQKTKLKGVKGKETEYMVNKGMVNAAYGLMCQSLTQNEYIYTNDEWSLDTSKLLSDTIKEYNDSPSRFTWYPWAVYVTAYARRNLWEGILEFEEDYLYADTDSIKCQNLDKHMDWVNGYNSEVVKKLELMCLHYGIDIERTRPCNKFGVKKQIGVWDIETAGGQQYKRFKSLGAKRYMVEHQDGSIEITIAGVNKKLGSQWMNKKKAVGVDPFKLFNDGLIFPAEEVGKNVAYYIDDEEKGVVVDYLGKEASWESKSSIAIAKSNYKLKMFEFMEYLTSIREEILL